ncbi:hypothetical protein ACH4D5_36110 [Streptomyces sp. NPDC018029]|uniref:hypothetical protein n=1 Tax=Streptomyces sp. NPDC018029 TaxID=3365032 RepID=UPI00378FA79D
MAASPSPEPYRLLRATDLLDLHFAFLGLRLERPLIGPRRLVRVDPGQPAFLVVTFGPQHVAEQAFFEVSPGLPESGTPVSGAAPAGSEPHKPPPVASRIGGRSLLVFTVAADDFVEYTESGLLTAMRTLPMRVVDAAAEPASADRSARAVTGRPLDVFQALRLARTTAELTARYGPDGPLAAGLPAVPAASEATPDTTTNTLPDTVAGPGPENPLADAGNPRTGIELPYRLLLSPPGSAAWTHTTSLPDPDGRVELWHTRMPAGHARAVWTRDPEFDPADPRALPAGGSEFTMALDRKDRSSVVHLSSNRNLPGGFSPAPLDVDHLILSAMGGWLDSFGRWNRPPTGFDVTQWRHRAALGRDHYVRVMYRGRLWPFGHLADLVKVTERKFDHTRPDHAAYLNQRFFIMVREPVRSYGQSEDNADQKRLRRLFPFTSVRLLTLVTPDLQKPQTIPGLSPIGGDPNEKLAFFPASATEDPFQFQVSMTDLEGRLVEFRTPMAFVGKLVHENKADVQVIVDYYRRLVSEPAPEPPDLSNPCVRRAVADVRGQSIAYAPSRKPGDTTLSTGQLIWGAVTTEAILALDPTDHPRFLPTVRWARAVIPALSRFGGFEGDVTQSVTGTPAARGAGITLLHTDRDRHLAGLIGADVSRQVATGDAVLTAMDLLRGYRVDIGVVDPATGRVAQWRSLLRRRGRYTVRRPGQQPVEIQVRPDEGLVRASAVTVDAADDRQLYGHQAVFGWDGWSLAAPRPGRTIGLDDQPEAPAPPVSPDVPLDTKFTPEPGSLPALRFGRTYRMRARAVDLAGNGLDHTASTPDAVHSDAITYGRWDPVPQPVVMPLLPFNEGESTERLVIRSTVTDDGRAISTDEYALRRSDVPDHDARSEVDGLDRRYKPVSERHVAPPKTALQMAEEHGVFDAVFGPDKPDQVREEYVAVASRESGSFLDTKVRDPEWPYLEHDLLRAGEIHIAKHDVHDPLPLTRLPLPHRGACLEQGEFVVHSADQLILPYLPDVLAEGVMLRGLPGDTENRKIPFPGPWPQAKPFRIRVNEGDGVPRWRDGLVERVLDVFLTKGEIATFRLSCYLDADKLPLLRQWNLLTASPFWADLSDADKAFVTRASADGENWMLTPWVELTLVHAVEKPVRPPRLDGLACHRTAEQTAAQLTGTLTSHAESSGHVELDAHWSEWLDDVTQPAPTRIAGHTHLEDIKLAYVADEEHVDRTHEFGDTRHRDVRYTPTAVTRFREYFHPSITEDRANVTRVGPTAAPLAVPSSRRPEPPAVAYVVPTFRWQRTVDEARESVTRHRRAAGLRVYLNRPWFSSGDDEMLAVLLDPGGTALPDTFATRWGVDPVWADTTVLPSPAAAHFPNAAKRLTGLRLAESPDAAPVAVDAVAFAPTYHSERRLWYVDVDVDFADAAVAGTTYFPYVRLALARYQPYSVDPLHLSKAERAEFAQLVPPRSVTGRREGGLLAVRLSGPVTYNEFGELSGTGAVAATASRRVVVSVQSRASLQSDEMDWRQVGAPVELTCRPDGGAFVWSGGIPAPTGQPLTSYRLLVQEYELYRTDQDTATDTVPVNGSALPAARRLVHADYFGLTVGLLGRVDFEL